MFYQSHGPAMALSSDDLNLRVPFVSCWNLNWYRFKESFFFFFNYGLISPTVDLCLFLLDLLWFLGSPIYHDLYSGLLPSVSQPPGATYICCCNSYPVSTTPQLGPRHPLLNIPLFGSTPSVILLLETSPGIVRIMTQLPLDFTCCRHSTADNSCLLTPPQSRRGWSARAHPSLFFHRSHAANMEHFTPNNISVFVFLIFLMRPE